MKEHAKRQPENALSRAVESTRTLYEKNGWVFLPLEETGRRSPRLSHPQAEHPPQESTPGEDEVSENLILYPRDTSPQSPPDSAAQEHGELQAGEQEESEEFDFDLGEIPPAIWRCSLPYPSDSKSNEEPERS